MSMSPQRILSFAAVLAAGVYLILRPCLDNSPKKLGDPRYAIMFLGLILIVWATLQVTLWSDRFSHFLSDDGFKILMAIRYYAGGCAVGISVTLALTGHLKWRKTVVTDDETHDKQRGRHGKTA